MNMNENIISIRLLQTAFTSEHYPALFAGTKTHDPGLRLVAQLVPYTFDDKWIEQIVRSGLPEGYAGNLIDELPEMIAGARKKGFDEQFGGISKPERSSKADKILEAFADTGAELFHDPSDRAFVSIPLQSGGTLSFPVLSNDAERWLREVYYRATVKVVASQQLNDILATLEARARYEGQQHDIHQRYGRVDDEIYVDLGRRDGKVVRIAGSQWSTTYSCPIKFYRGAGFGELPEPQEDGDLYQLRDLLHLSTENFILVLAFALTAMSASGPYMCLLVEGEQGSGKSLLCEILARTIDPRAVPKFRLPDNERDLMIHAKERHLLVYDNASGMRAAMSDALCSLSTGGGFATRRLYTDDALQEFVASRPFIVNGISDVASRPDLLDRAVRVHLPSMTEETRRSEKRLMDQYHQALPHLLGSLFDCISCALGSEDSVEEPRTLRMADCAHWLSAAEQATGLPHGTFIEVLERNQTELVSDRIANDALVIALLALVEGEPFVGTMSELHRALSDNAALKDRSFPSTPQHLRRQIERLRPALRKVGLFIENGPRTKERRSVRVWLEGQDPATARDRRSC
jgi:hypothetical protein